MALEPGARLGPYEILSAFGARRMGEVYCAHDTELNRDVALKIFPDLFAGDARETRVVLTVTSPKSSQRVT